MSSASLVPPDRAAKYDIGTAERTYTVIHVGQMIAHTHQRHRHGVKPLIGCVNSRKFFAFTFFVSFCVILNFV